MTILEAFELVHQAKTRIERAKRNQNVHEDIKLMEELVSLVEVLQQSLREATSIPVTAR